MDSVSVSRELKVIKWKASLQSFCAAGALFQHKVGASLVGVCLKLTEKLVYFRLCGITDWKETSGYKTTLSGSTLRQELPLVLLIANGF